MNQVKHTPIIAQYLSVKEQYPDMLVFFRMGDFYELFFEDAKIASSQLNIALTKRAYSGSDPIPMAGVPHHAADNYIAKLLKQNISIVICDQNEDKISDPKNKLISREVTRIITPGTLSDEQFLEAGKDNILSAIHKLKTCFTIAWLNLSAGKIHVTIVPNEIKLNAIIMQLDPQEILIPEDLNLDIIKNNTQNKSIKKKLLWEYEYNQCLCWVKSQFQTAHTEALLPGEFQKAIPVVGCLINYINFTQRQRLSHIKNIQLENQAEYLQIDAHTQTHLQLFNEPGLLNIINKTSTAMGSRLLKRWLSFPITNRQILISRHQAIKSLLRLDDIGNNNLFDNISDLERICTRIALKTVKPRELLLLKTSLISLPKLKNIFKIENQCLIKKLLEIICTPIKCLELIEKAIEDEPSVHIKDGGIFKKDYDSSLDSLRNIAINADILLQQLLEEEKITNNMPLLKVGYNKITGYYFEHSKNKNTNNIPKHFKRIQTLKSIERYSTDKLKAHEINLLTAKTEALAREKFLYNELLETINNEIDNIQNIALAIAELDVLVNFANIAITNNWCQPLFTDQKEITIIGGRHPIVEYYSQKSFIRNDFSLNKTQTLMLLTGPNMGGKSTYMRQQALIVILAHIGSFVPAEKAIIPNIDQIFTRIGAHDQLTQGLSTFMVEMTETATILRHATANSLILIDELGRGTSTHDGMALAQATFSYLATKINGYTIFSTHYFELTNLAKKIKNIANYYLQSVIQNNKLIFLYKLAPGAVEQSYGIEVASLAGIPIEVIENAKSIINNIKLKKLENITHDTI